MAPCKRGRLRGAAAVERFRTDAKAEGELVTVGGTKLSMPTVPPIPPRGGEVVLYEAGPLLGSLGFRAGRTLSGHRLSRAARHHAGYDAPRGGDFQLGAIFRELSIGRRDHR